MKSIITTNSLVKVKNIIFVQTVKQILICQLLTTRLCFLQYYFPSRIEKETCPGEVASSEKKDFDIKKIWNDYREKVNCYNFSNNTASSTHFHHSKTWHQKWCHKMSKSQTSFYGCTPTLYTKFRHRLLKKLFNGFQWLAWLPFMHLTFSFENFFIMIYEYFFPDLGFLLEVFRKLSSSLMCTATIH